MNNQGVVTEVIRELRQDHVLHIRVKGDTQSAVNSIESLEIVEATECDEEGRIRVTVKEGVEDYSEISTHLVEQGHRILEFREDELNLESAFMALTKGTSTRM